MTSDNFKINVLPLEISSSSERPACRRSAVESWLPLPPSRSAPMPSRALEIARVARCPTPALKLNRPEAETMLHHCVGISKCHVSSSSFYFFLYTFKSLWVAEMRPASFAAMYTCADPDSCVNIRIQSCFKKKVGCVFYASWFC